MSIEKKIDDKERKHVVKGLYMYGSKQMSKQANDPRLNNQVEPKTLIDLYDNYDEVKLVRKPVDPNILEKYFGYGLATALLSGTIIALMANCSAHHAELHGKKHLFYPEKVVEETYKSKIPEVVIPPKPIDTWTDLRERLDTPEKVADFLPNIKYKSEIGNHTQPPEETFRLKTGDCEDYACFIVDTLSYHGYNARMVAVFDDSRSKGHAVGAYTDPITNKWGYIEQDGEIRDGFNTIDDLVNDLSDECKIHGRYTVLTSGEFISMYDR